MMDETKEPAESVVDVADAWAAALHKTAEIDPTVKASGSKRRGVGSSAAVEVNVAPRVKPEDVAPLVKALGAVSTRMADVSGLTDQEITDIAEPSARLLEILGPDALPDWAIPAMTLSARIGDVAAARRDEFRAKRPTSEADAPLRDEAQTELSDDF